LDPEPNKKNIRTQIKNGLGTECGIGSGTGSRNEFRPGNTTSSRIELGAGTGFRSRTGFRLDPDLELLLLLFGIIWLSAALEVTADCKLRCRPCHRTAAVLLNKKMRNCQACGFPLSNVYWWLWQSAVLPFSLCQSEEFTPRIATISVTYLSAELSKREKSICRRLTSTGPLFDASYLFDKRLYRCDTDTRRIV
jgi:ribosomal protein L37E